ncbi:MAG: iron export ABC transporter permease subunit FetB [Cyanobacteria bacterium]|nr:iron export ABC transporter permease subunit FetB [Cyanobacteriota bacterium]MDW8203194.1 iron export ABC transporter permease subunit FetB [Cyanobacteriota bacterium SKYGB_h_bin112]
MPIQPLTLVDLAIALGMVIMAIGLSIWQRLDLAWNLVVASGRTIIQLLVVGVLLAAVFQIQSPWLVVGILVAMLVVAAITARNRISPTMPRLVLIVILSMLTSTVLTLLYTITLVVRSQPWYSPQYLIPLGGIVLGNAMNAAAIAGEHLVNQLQSSRLDIETHLSLGATAHQATITYRREAVRASMIPMINTMTVVGLVTLPSTITGQLLGGISPLDAAAYQMLIMFMLALANLVTALLVTMGIQRQWFNAAEQLTNRC